jgi:hypothetical protein
MVDTREVLQGEKASWGAAWWGWCQAPEGADHYHDSRGLRMQGSAQMGLEFRQGFCSWGWQQNEGMDPARRWMAC